MNCVTLAYTIEELVTQTASVGIREFRENLAGYLESKAPSCHHQVRATIGISTPTKPTPGRPDLEALRVAGKKMQNLHATAGATEDEIVGDCTKSRRKRRIRRG
ncbi:MAG: hypothetical protein LC114_12250 [Bryobacterales bacterium]|nr:hypothetical protein [Bryobacterales bacterium]